MESDAAADCLRYKKQGPLNRQPTPVLHVSGVSKLLADNPETLRNKLETYGPIAQDGYEMFPGKVYFEFNCILVCLDI